ncbi:nucleotide-binding protein [Bremerella sp. P1]|uniref:nucleotide-binding protein n=1 Tax=Bremerella sp. P1 TaxID=3026424 RepID=UPI002368B3B5|nr:nucleotide-binding protein [Bremerella sp. P1]WDI43240.1 nucleotide-binding protein [Bremerella sp. P1]
MPEFATLLTELEVRALNLFQSLYTEERKLLIEKAITLSHEFDIAHSGSWLGYHSLVYYEGIERPPSGAFFDRQWGLQDRFSNSTEGDWVKYSHSEIYDYLVAQLGKADFEEILDVAKENAAEIDDLREDLLAIIEACLSNASDQYLEKVKSQVDKARMVPQEKFCRSIAPPPPPITHDHTAVSGGTVVPPHVTFRASLQSVRTLLEIPQDLAKIARRTNNYLKSKIETKDYLMGDQTGTRVFIGHGKSTAWLELKNYIQDRLGVTCDDFNRQATAGQTTISRLTTMLEEACFAFLVLTAEDIQKDDRVHARLNVVHEAGLFQGKLGFEKAIVMLESDCEEFSNIHGLGQIRFDSGKISGAFHEVADTLKREGVIS